MRNLYRASALLTALVLGAAGTSFSQTPTMPAGPWKDLFNGKDLTGWASVGNPPWSIANGILQTKGGSTKTYLIWNEPLKDVELSVKYRMSSNGTNSGIQVRSTCADRTKTLPNCGGTHQVCGVQLDVAMSYSGRLFEECTGFLQFDGQNIDNCRRTLAVGSWMTTVARFDGAKVSLWLNGTHCLDFTLTKAENLSGNIFAIQSHPPFDLIEWEHIKIRKLNIRGCTNKSATNYNPEATLDDGSCKTTGVRVSAARPAPSVGASRSRVDYSIPASGNFTVRLQDVNGVVAGAAGGVGPISGSLALQRPGIYFLEVNSAGALSRFKINNF